jgi:hypothetical protein
MMKRINGFNVPKDVPKDVPEDIPKIKVSQGIPWIYINNFNKF